jgi:phage baseplate assembly protein W
MKYYALPFDARRATRELPKTDVEESVRQHIRLLLLTMPGSFRFSPWFGSWLNKHHHRLPDKRKGEKKLENELKEKLQANLRQLLSRYEPRLALHDVEVTVQLAPPGEPHEKGGRILFNANVIGTLPNQESFNHTQSVYLK